MYLGDCLDSQNAISIHLSFKLQLHPLSQVEKSDRSICLAPFKWNSRIWTGSLPLTCFAGTFHLNQSKNNGRSFQM
jgi:hypothetical protein